ncbi:hypothetical protein [Desulfopila sp. IMCC35008]|uniref:hypothetical protein n=1 Tax=Desulfopila sp. IMCC35008 TaxID=2653858 RepID=UPI0013D37C55|nr:hypothetical protein [Desulfopila sp. IMCC35008]
MKRFLPIIISAILLTVTMFAVYEIFISPDLLQGYDREMEFLIVTLFLCIGLSFGTMIICVVEVISMKSVTKRLGSINQTVTHLHDKNFM